MPPQQVSFVTGPRTRPFRLFRARWDFWLSRFGEELQHRPAKLRAVRLDGFFRDPLPAWLGHFAIAADSASVRKKTRDLLRCQTVLNSTELNYFQHLCVVQDRAGGLCPCYRTSSSAEV